MVVSTNTRPVPNTSSPVVDTKTGKLLAPWIQFFQQFVQQAAASIDISKQSPYQANQNGTIFINQGSSITITRGQTVIQLADGQAIIPVSIGDTVAFTVPFAGSAQFFGS